MSRTDYTYLQQLQARYRIGSKVKRVYDDARTPCACGLASDHVSDEHKAELREAYGCPNPIDLRRRIDELQEQRLHSLSLAK